jgi:hypothetical protein
MGAVREGPSDTVAFDVPLVELFEGGGPPSGRVTFTHTDALAQCPPESATVKVAWNAPGAAYV